MKKLYKSKTFQKDDNSYEVFLWANEVVCKYSRETEVRDPGEMEIVLTHKVKVIIEINTDE